MLQPVMTERVKQGLISSFLDLAISVKCLKHENVPKVASVNHDSASELAILHGFILVYPWCIHIHPQVWGRPWPRFSCCRQAGEWIQAPGDPLFDAALRAEAATAGICIYGNLWHLWFGGSSLLGGLVESRWMSQISIDFLFAWVKKGQLSFQRAR